MGCDRTQNTRLCILSAAEALCCDSAASGYRREAKLFQSILLSPTSLMNMQFCAVVLKITQNNSLTFTVVLG